MVLDGDKGVSLLLPLNVQNCSHRAGIKNECMEKGKAHMFLSYIGILDEKAKFAQKCSLSLTSLSQILLNCQKSCVSEKQKC